MRQLLLSLASVVTLASCAGAADVDPKDLGVAHRPIEVDAEAVAAAGTGLFGMGIACTVFVVLLGLIVNFAPAIIAAMRKHPNTLPIFLVVLFLGWTGVGWIAALIWSFTSPHAGTTVVVRQYNDNRRSRRRDDD